MLSYLTLCRLGFFGLLGLREGKRKVSTVNVSKTIGHIVMKFLHDDDMLSPSICHTSVGMTTNPEVILT